MEVEGCRSYSTCTYTIESYINLGQFIYIDKIFLEGVGGVIRRRFHKIDFGFVYYESIKREVQRRPIYECRYDERLLKMRDLQWYDYYESIK